MWVPVGNKLPVMLPLGSTNVTFVLHTAGAPLWGSRGRVTTRAWPVFLANIVTFIYPPISIRILVYDAEKLDNSHLQVSHPAEL